MPKYDYHQLNVMFGQICKRKKLQMIELNGDGTKPRGTFVAFDIISPYLPLGYRENDDAQEIFECVVSLTVYSMSKTEAFNDAADLRSSLDAVEVTDALNLAKIVVVNAEPVQVRYAPTVTQTAKMVGFDIRLRLRGIPEAPPESIDNITFKEG